MKNRNAVMWRRSERVPKWFRGVLHQVMYSNITEAHSMITAIDRMLECSADERVLIVLCAMGLEQSMIAEFLGISRFSLRRRLDSLRKRREYDFLGITESVGDLSPLLVCFAEVCEEEEAYSSAHLTCLYKCCVLQNTLLSLRAKGKNLRFQGARLGVVI